MTNQALPQPGFDPTDPWQCVEYFGRWLLQADPDEFAASIKRMQEWATWVAVEGVKRGLLMHGFKRGNREQRMQAYVRKFYWPTERGDDGLLLHPVMTTQPVIDPQSGQPLTQTVPSQTEGEDLWSLQLQKFPRQFVIDAKDAFAIGAPLPQWVLQEVGLIMAHETRPEGKRALKRATETRKYEPVKVLRRAA